MVILFSSYELLKAEYQQRHGGAVTIPTPAATLFGGLSGALAGYLTTPMDVVKTRIMVLQGQSTTIGIREALRSVGTWRMLWTGATARSVWWLGICSIFFPSYEATKSLLLDLF